MPSDRPEVSLKNPASRLEVTTGSEPLIVRPLGVADAPAVAEAVAESLPELRRYMIWAHYPQSVEVQRERLKSVNALYWRGEDFGFGAFRAGAFVAGFGLHFRTLNPRAVELGYWVRSSAAGSGLATTLSKALTAYAFLWLGCDRVQVGHNTHNAASRRVIEKCGFMREGTLRYFEPQPTAAMVEAGCEASDSMHLYALTRADLPELPWLPSATAALGVYDWLGRPVALSQVTGNPAGS